MQCFMKPCCYISFNTHGVRTQGVQNHFCETRLTCSYLPQLSSIDSYHYVDHFGTYHHPNKLICHADVDNLCDLLPPNYIVSYHASLRHHVTFHGPLEAISITVLTTLHNLPRPICLTLWTFVIDIPKPNSIVLL